MGNHAGHTPDCHPSIPKTAARNPSGTAPTSPKIKRAGGKLKKKNGTIAPISAISAGTAADPDAAPAAAYAPNPNTDIAAAIPSLPSMKLKRLAIQTIATSTIAQLGDGVAIAIHKAAAAI